MYIPNSQSVICDTSSIELATVTRESGKQTVKIGNSEILQREKQAATFIRSEHCLHVILPSIASQQGW